MKGQRGKVKGQRGKIGAQSSKVKGERKKLRAQSSKVKGQTVRREYELPVGGGDDELLVEVSRDLDSS